MRRNVIILAVAIAAGTTVALLIGFWPSMTVPQDTSHDIQGVNTANRAVNIPETSTYQPYLGIANLGNDNSFPTVIIYYTKDNIFSAYGSNAKRITDAEVITYFKFTSVNQLYCANDTGRIFYGTYYQTISTWYFFKHNGGWYMAALNGVMQDSAASKSFISSILALK